ncbi:MAG TPA: ATP-binding protein [Candidatus Polarisedimenticolaceae bacterium]
MNRPCLALALSALVSARASAVERLVRSFDSPGGAANVGRTSLDQDADGYLWVGSEAGLFRFDGYETRPIAQGTFSVIEGCGARGRVLVNQGGVHLFRTAPGGLEPVETPIPQPFADFRHTVCDDGGTLWFLSGDTIWRLEPGGASSRVPLTLGDGERLYRLSRGRGSSIVVGTDRRVAELAVDGSLREIAALPHVARAVARGDGSWVFFAFDPRTRWGVWTARDGVAAKRFDIPGLPAGLVVRGEAIWASFDYGMIVARPDRSVEFLRSTPAEPTGGAILLDREGSLWAASPRGLRQYPEPDTVGLHPPESVLFTRYLRLDRGGVEISSWSGRYRAVATGTGLALLPTPLQGVAAACTDAGGRQWTVTDHTFVVVAPGGAERRPAYPGVYDLHPCASGDDGAMWMPTNAGLFRLGRDAPAPSKVLDGATTAVVVLPTGEVLAAREREACASRDGVAWSCVPLEAAGLAPWTLHVATSGNVYAAGPGARGILRRGSDGSWADVAVDPPLGGLPVRLAPSPRGGIWIAASGEVVRAIEDIPGVLRVVERLGASQGFPGVGGTDVLELDDGTVCVGAGVSLVRIPAAARDRSAPIGRLVITGATVDGASVDPSKPFELPFRRNRLELHASALTFRDPSSVRYRHRLRPGDRWSDPVVDPHLRFFDLPHGRYDLSLQASLDGSTWIDAPAPVRFRIDEPWYLSRLFFALLAGVAAGSAWIAARIRAGRRRVLEEQRRRIAMDLHDAIGSGLGTIGLLAGPLREAGAPIAAIAAELGVSLADIVWSLRESSGSLEAVAEHLLQRGRAMFAEGAAEIRFDFPGTWPSRELSLPLRRNLVLIALEAMHNAARHSGAGRVTLRLAREGHGWILEVVDDGRGLGGPTRPGGGMGLGNMRRRAEDIGARLEIASPPGGGTCVRVRFAL